jgi:hypothetical protein
MATYFKGVTNFMTGITRPLRTRNRCDKFVTNDWILRHGAIPPSVKQNFRNPVRVIVTSFQKTAMRFGPF